MSDKDLDSLFKNKLEEFHKTPVRDLWAEINEQLPNKAKTPGYWILGIAASLLLLVTVGVVFYNYTTEDSNVIELANNDQPIEKNVEHSEVQQSSKIETSVTKDEEIPELTTTPKETKHVINKEIKKTPAKTNSAQSILKTELNEVQVAENNMDTNSESNNVNEAVDIKMLVIDQEDVAANNNETQATPSVDNASKSKQPGSTLTFDINDLGQKEELASNDTKDAKKESKLKQLFNIAKDLKEGESGISDLREAKNELFAMNFRKDENGK